VQREVFEETKTAGATLIKLKGGSGFAVGLSIREVVHAIALDSRRILPVSTLQQGLYGIRDVCLSLPTVVGCGGARQQIELPLAQKETLALQQSARVLRETIEQVEGRIAAAGKQPGALDGKATEPALSAKPASTGGRPIPRSAWQRSGSKA
jgi:L-lactate dehydrogenase